MIALTADMPKVPDWKRPALLGYALIVFTFVVLGGWSAVAKLDGAVVAPGTVAVESNRKTVQHYEGGIIRDILVREGDRVQAGQVLYKLDLTQARANLDLQQNQLFAAMAQEARLVAERDGVDQIRFPSELLDHREDPTVKRAMSDQTKQFADRQASLHGQVDLLQSKIEQSKIEIRGLVAEQEGTQGQLKFIKDELTDLTGLFEKQLVPKTRVLSLEREKSRLEGVTGRSIAEQAKAQNTISESDLQIRQLHQKLSEEVSTQILEVRQKIADQTQRVSVAKDVFRRLDVLAPVSGTVQNVRVFTLGGVIRAGDPLLDIVPDHDSFIIQAHVAPQDMESVVPGMPAEVHFAAFRTSVLPLILGRVESVSRDRLLDDSTKQPYFLVQVKVDDIPPEVAEKLVAGMPAELILPTGERTALDYLVRPLKDRMRSALREK
jgi:HlyD family type I secretion membrane fusion protein